MDWPVSSPPGGQWTFSRSQQEANSSPGPSSSPSTSRYQHHIPSSPSPLRSSDPVKPVTPGAFVSPRQSKLYPLADSTADVLEQRRLGFFQRQAMSATPSTSASSSMLPPLLQPGPSSARSSASARRERFKKPPSSSSPSTGLIAGDDVSASLYRQRFRERCQAVMARDRGRKKAIARSRGRDIDAELGISSDEEDEGGGASGSRGIQMGRRGQQQKVILNSDDLSSSDRGEDHNAWQEEDEEVSCLANRPKQRLILRLLIPFSLSLALRRITASPQGHASRVSSPSTRSRTQRSTRTWLDRSRRSSLARRGTTKERCPTR